MTPVHGVDAELLATMRKVFADRRAAAEPPPGSELDGALWATLDQLGLTRLTGAESEGGSGGSLADAAALWSVAAEHAAPVPLAEHDFLAGWLLQSGGLPPAGTPRAACRLDAQGTAAAVPWARTAGKIVILWQRDRAWRVAEAPLTAFRVRPGTNLAGEPRDDLGIDPGGLAGVPVPDQIAEEFVLRGALVRAVQMCGAMDRIVDLSVTHAAQRSQFGRPLAKFQSVQNLVSDLAAESALARAATDAAVRSAAHGWNREARIRIAMARSVAGHASGVVVRNAHQVHGAIGTTAEHELHRFTTRLLSWRSEFGSVHEWEVTLTDAAAQAGRDGLWALIVDGAGSDPA